MPVARHCRIFEIFLKYDTGGGLFHGGGIRLTPGVGKGVETAAVKISVEPGKRSR